MKIYHDMELNISNIFFNRNHYANEFTSFRIDNKLDFK